MDIVIVGAGPAGLMCAIKSSENKNNKVTILEGNEKAGKKLYITGKGRCNVCNNTDVEGFLSNVVNNKKFLYTAINNFKPEDCINFFETNGTKLKVERGNRVFPVSDKASDITKTFLKILEKRKNANILYSSKVSNIVKEGNKFLININNKSKILTDVVVIATGGKSYSSTGSTGDGYKFAQTFGHTIIPIKPALSAINLKNYDGGLAGLTLKNVALYATNKEKTFQQFGEMLFTHKGISGPIVLTISSFINKLDLNSCNLKIDFKPALTVEKLEERLIRDFAQGKKNLKNYLKELLPSSFIPYFLKTGNFDENLILGSISKVLRQKIVNFLKNYPLEIKGLEDVEFSIITSGGVMVKEIDPKNMQSKLLNNLFFIGEVLDVDALTGGYNIQIALSTGFCAGKYLSEQ